MKNTAIIVLTIFLTVLPSFVARPIFAQDEEYSGMKGTETPEFQESSDTAKCFVFGKYVVKTIQGEDVGEKITVYERGVSANAERACQSTDEPYLKIDDSNNNFFYGISAALLFIDSGTSAGSRGLTIYNLGSRKSIVNESYTNDPTLSAGRFVIFDSPSDKKGLIRTCKEAAKWKRDGGGVGWVQGKKLDLQTLKLIDVGVLRCTYME